MVASAIIHTNTNQRKLRRWKTFPFLWCWARALQQLLHHFGQTPPNRIFGVLFHLPGCERYVLHQERADGPQWHGDTPEIVHMNLDNERMLGLQLTGVEGGSDTRPRLHHMKGPSCLLLFAVAIVFVAPDNKIQKLRQHVLADAVLPRHTRSISFESILMQSHDVEPLGLGTLAIWPQWDIERDLVLVERTIKTLITNVSQSIQRNLG
mmetsp:Transcript_23116/g.50946  ORF Transcript_23116/g.50946 Transcript_23116/m.50946 type:complete len:208 (-) Transcript_23116:507-1130(-)